MASLSPIDCETLLAGLHCEIISTAEVIAWADERVKSAAQPSEALIELSLAPSNDAYEVGKRLRAVCGEWSPLTDSGIARLLGIIARIGISGNWPHAVNLIYNLLGWPDLSENEAIKVAREIDSYFDMAAWGEGEVTTAGTEERWRKLATAAERLFQCE